LRILIGVVEAIGRSDIDDGGDNEDHHFIRNGKQMLQQYEG